MHVGNKDIHTIATRHRTPQDNPRVVFLPQHAPDRPPTSTRTPHKQPSTTPTAKTNEHPSDTDCAISPDAAASRARRYPGSGRLFSPDPCEESRRLTSGHVWSLGDDESVRFPSRAGYLNSKTWRNTKASCFPRYYVSFYTLTFSGLATFEKFSADPHVPAYNT
ncbi:hypothetical protein NQ317_005085 [Molorchus minor]|uniref:Uncharacterized protein n=1 Tax=Molorchus minor TaxID=1323400 RepID=A0ABQ9JZ26_9CUCU|nr:hypothetical protein NQ317_005085 [Molorchus minor]